MASYLVSTLDLNGTWDGIESANQISNRPFPIRFVIHQSDATAEVKIFGAIGKEYTFPATPQDIGICTLVGGSSRFQTTEFVKGNVPFTTNDWNITFIKEKGVIHFEHHKHYLMPGDKRPDTYTSGDLTKSVMF